MKFNRSFLIIGMLLLMAIPFTSAGTLNDPDSWDYTYEFHEPDENNKYGYYYIEDTFLWIFNKKEIKTVKLIENDYSVLSAWNIKEIEVFQPTKLFDRTDYFAKDKETDRSSAIKSEQQLYRQLINKTRYITVNGNCTQYNTITNGTNQTTYCIEYEDLGDWETYEEWTDWEEYNWHSVTPGLYQTKTIVQRVNQYTGVVDWIDENEGRKLSEWATWWDANWAKKREISSLDGTISGLYNITYYSGQTDFDDLRFLDFATESEELNYSIISKVDGVSALVRIDDENETTVMMYYDNPSATSTASFDDLYFSPKGAYLFDTGNADDFSQYNNDGTNSNAVLSSSGYIGHSYVFDEDDTDWIIADSEISGDTTVSGVVWFKSSVTVGVQPLPMITLNADNGVRNTGFLTAFRENQGGKVSILINGIAWGTNSASTYNDGNWHMAVLTRSGSDYNLYIDGGSSAVSTLNNAGGTFGAYNLIGNRANAVAGDISFNGALDEVMFYDRVLTTTEMQYLYGQTQPSFVVGSEQTNIGTTIQQLTPANALTTDDIVLDFTYNITTDGLNFTNTTLSIWNDTDDTLYLTNFSSLSGNTSQIINYTNTLQDGDWKWNAEVCTSDDACTTGSNRTLTIDTTPFIEIITPTQGTNIISSSVPVTVNLTEKYFDELIINITNVNGTLANTTTITDGTRTFTFNGVPDGNYNVTAQIVTNTSQSNSTNSGQFLVHTTTPQIIINDPSGTLGGIVIGDNETLNYSISEIGENITHFEECWFEYNNTEVISSPFSEGGYTKFITNYANVTQLRTQVLFGSTSTFTSIDENCSRRGNITFNTILDASGSDITCLDEQDNEYFVGRVETLSSWSFVDVTAMERRPLNCSETNSSFEYVFGKDSLCVHAVDEFGLHSQNDTTWQYSFVEGPITFNNETIEGSTETFTYEFSKLSDKQVSRVNLVYDGTEYSTQFLDVNNVVTSQISITIPNVNNDTNKTFYFNVLFSDGIEDNSTVNTQLVSQLLIDDCSSYSNLIFNYTHKDEEMQTNLLNGTIELAINVYDLARSDVFLNFSKSYENINPAQVCININFENNTRYSLDSVAKYTSNESSGYALEYYNLLNFSLENSTIPKNINLYSLLSSDSTEFQLTFRDANLALAPNILVSVDRQYVSDNDFKTVERPITDTNGQVILHLVRNDIQYNFIMTDSAGNVIGTFNKKNVFCQDFTIGSCTLNLNAVEGEVQLYNSITDQGIVYSTSYTNSTNILALEFLSLDLTPRKVGLKATRDTDFGNRSVCFEELTSSSGIISCNVSTIANTDRFLFLEIFVDDDLKANEIEDLEYDNSGLGANGFFLAFFMILVIITIFMEDKKILVLAIVVGWVGVISLGLVRGTLFGSLSAGIWLVVTAIIFLWKLNKEDAP